MDKNIFKVLNSNKYYRFFFRNVIKTKYANRSVKKLETKILFNIFSIINNYVEYLNEHARKEKILNMYNDIPQTNLKNISLKNGIIVTLIFMKHLEKYSI